MHVFFSYMREDWPKIEVFYEELRRLGVTIWLDRESIMPGERWKFAIEQAIRKGAMFIAFFSNRYSGKTESYQNEEITIAIDVIRKSSIERRFFIPARLEDCKVPEIRISSVETISDFNYLDIFPDPALAATKLFAASRKRNEDDLALKEALAEAGIGEIQVFGSKDCPEIVMSLHSRKLSIRGSSDMLNPEEFYKEIIEIVNLISKYSKNYFEIVFDLDRIGSASLSVIRRMVYDLSRSGNSALIIRWKTQNKSPRIASNIDTLKDFWETIKESDSDRMPVFLIE